MNRTELGILVKRHREQRNESQEDVASRCGIQTSRTDIAHLEQGLRLPRPDVLEKICAYVGVPAEYWHPFTREHARLRLEFEEILSELTGQSVNLESQDNLSEAAVEQKVAKLFRESLSPKQTLDLFNSICVFYGVGPITTPFFMRYLGPKAFASTSALSTAVQRYQQDAIRLFVSLRESFKVLNAADHIDIYLAPLAAHDMEVYHEQVGLGSVS